MTRALPDRAARLGRRAVLAGAAGIAVSLAGAVWAPAAFAYSWLVAFLFWTGLALGCLAVLMMHYLTGGAWGVVIRRPLEAGAATLPLLAVLFVPIALAMHSLYAWSTPAGLLDEIVQRKRAYLNAPFFFVRAAAYFAIWIGLASAFSRGGRRQDDRYDAQRAAGLRKLAAGGLVIYVLTLTFAVTDWVMSLDPHWFSTIFGVLFVGGHGVLALCFAILLAAWLREEPPLQRVLGPARFHDLGMLLLAFVMLWAYFAFSQFLIIWAENLPDEISWYHDRSAAGWQIVAAVLALGHFAVPFLLLLSRRLKRTILTLVGIALMLVAMRLVDLYWMVMPRLDPGAPRFHWIVVTALIGIGGLWARMFLGRLMSRPLLPRNDPALEEIGAAGWADARHAERAT